jgi:hypothetical protein
MESVLKCCGHQFKRTAPIGQTHAADTDWKDHWQVAENIVLYEIVVVSIP